MFQEASPMNLPAVDTALAAWYAYPTIAAVVAGGVAAYPAVVAFLSAVVAFAIPAVLIVLLALTVRRMIPLAVELKDIRATKQTKIEAVPLLMPGKIQLPAIEAGTIDQAELLTIKIKETTNAQ